MAESICNIADRQASYPFDWTDNSEKGIENQSLIFYTGSGSFSANVNKRKKYL
jgi:hypothetical protein